MRAIAICVFSIAACGIIQRQAHAAGSPINSIDVTTYRAYSGTHYDPSTLDKALVVIGVPEAYHLADGTQWAPGAGGFSYNRMSAVASVSGSVVSYALTPQFGIVLLQTTDYDSGNNSANGELDVASPLILSANIGSATAVLSGYALLVSNDYANVKDDRFHFFNAPIGSLVPFQLNYTLASGPWSQNTFDAPFDYSMVGSIDFTHAVPEPSTFALAALGAVALLVVRRRVT